MPGYDLILRSVCWNPTLIILATTASFPSMSFAASETQYGDRSWRCCRLRAPRTSNGPTKHCEHHRLPDDALITGVAWLVRWALVGPGQFGIETTWVLHVDLISSSPQSSPSTGLATCPSSSVATGNPGSHGRWWPPLPQERRIAQGCRSGRRCGARRSSTVDRPAYDAGEGGSALRTFPRPSRCGDRTGLPRRDDADPEASPTTSRRGSRRQQASRVRSASATRGCWRRPRPDSPSPEGSPA